MLQHECPLARAAGAGEAGVHDRDDREDLPAVLLCLDADAVAADLAAGTLACPSCQAGRLARWGYGRDRAVRLRGGRTTRLRPRRARCRSCRRTRILLPSWCAPTPLGGADQPRRAGVDDQQRAGQAALAQVAQESVPRVIRLAGCRVQADERRLALGGDPPVGQHRLGRGVGMVLEEAGVQEQVA